MILTEFPQKKSAGRTDRRLKIIFFVTSFCLFISLFSVAYYIVAKTPRAVASPDGTLLVRIPYGSARNEGVGYTPEPILPLEIRFPEGYERYSFLLDSGATITSLPYEMIGRFGYTPLSLPRVAFMGYGNTTSFAYQATIPVRIGGREDVLPVVFTEAKNSKLLLGRKGFFDRYSVYFLHNENALEIRI